MDSGSSAAGGWRVRRSIALELGIAVEFVRTNRALLPPSLFELALAVPDAWVQGYRAFGHSSESATEYLGRWAGVLEVDDYDTASAAMREITIDDAIDQSAAATGLQPRLDLDPAERLLDLQVRVYVEFVQQLGLLPASDPAVLEREREQIVATIDVLRGGPQHGRFWHWMDRFYYEAYRPWRAERLDAIAALERTAIDGLGGREGTGPPELGWLPPINILRSYPGVAAAARAGEFDVVFWAEPFGIESAVAFAPGSLMTSFAEDGVDYEYTTTVRDELATKLKALADPTRIGVLRMIRYFDDDNTQIARYLEVSRPTVSVHAKMLADAGFITTTREGRQARHAFHPDAVRQLVEQLLRYLDVSAE